MAGPGKICCCLLIVLLGLFSLVLCEETQEEQRQLLEEASKVKFLLYTRESPSEPWNFELNALRAVQLFDHTKPTKILVHGWKSYWGSPFNVLVKNAFLLEHDVNVIVVSWEYASMTNYFSAKRSIIKVGKVVAYLIDKLCKERGVQLEDVHVIGHSLGAHVAGIAGHYTTVGKIPRVTGLDPAGPFISFDDNEMRLSSESADFVDVIHTAAWTLGTHHTIGDVDFFPNGGQPIQPGCGLDIGAFRSHRRAYWLFASSIQNPFSFAAVECDNWEDFKSGNCKDNQVGQMGFHVKTNARGKYFLRTGSEMPYGLGNSTDLFQ